MMKLVLITLSAFVLWVSLVVADEECKKEIHDMFETMKELGESTEAPQCVKDFELSQYLCGGDKEKAKETMPKLKEFVKGLSDEDKTTVKECFSDLFKTSIEKVNMQEHCIEKAEHIKEHLMKMTFSE